MLTSLLFVNLLAAQQPQMTGEELFASMEKHIKQAKTQQVKFTIESKEPIAGALTMKGTLVVGQDGKARLVFEGSSSGQPSKVTLVSDGTTSHLRSEHPAKTVEKSFATPMNLDKFLRAKMTGAGLQMAINGAFIGLLDGNRELASQEKASGFKFVGREKLGGTEALVITFQLEAPQGQEGNCKVWLDPKTHLPLKRVMQARKNGEVTLENTESYSEWNVAHVPEENAFSLPKK